MSIIFKNRKGGNSGGSGSSTAQLAYAESTGSWLPVENSTSTNAIHTALTRTGKIFYMAGSEWDLNNRNGPFTA